MRRQLTRRGNARIRPYYHPIIKLYMICTHLRISWREEAGFIAGLLEGEARYNVGISTYFVVILRDSTPVEASLDNSCVSFGQILGSQPRVKSLYSTSKQAANCKSSHHTTCNNILLAHTVRL